MNKERQYELAKIYPSLLFCETEGENKPVHTSHFDIPKEFVEYFDFIKFIKNNVVDITFLTKYKSYIDFEELKHYICSKEIFFEVYDKLSIDALAHIRSSQISLDVFEVVIEQRPEYFDHNFFLVFCANRDDLTEEFIQKYLYKIDLKELGESIKHLSKEFILNHIDEFFIYNLVYHITDESLMREIFSKVKIDDDLILSTLQNQTAWSEDFIDEIYEKYLSETTLTDEDCFAINTHNLPSEKFLEKHINEYSIDTLNLIIEFYELYGKLNRDFIKRHLDSFIPTQLLRLVSFDENFIMENLWDRVPHHRLFTHQIFPIEFIYSELKSGQLSDNELIAIFNCYNIPPDVVKDCNLTDKFNYFISDESIKRWYYKSDEEKESFKQRIREKFVVKEDRIIGYLGGVGTFIGFDMKDGKTTYSVKSSYGGNKGFEIINEDQGIGSLCFGVEKKVSVSFDDITFVNFTFVSFHTDKITVEEE